MPGSFEIAISKICLRTSAATARLLSTAAAATSRSLATATAARVLTAAAATAARPLSAATAAATGALTATAAARILAAATTAWFLLTFVRYVFGVTLAHNVTPSTDSLVGRNAKLQHAGQDTKIGGLLGVNRHFYRGSGRNDVGRRALPRDPDWHSLNDLHEVPRSVVRRQQRERRTRPARQAVDASVE